MADISLKGQAIHTSGELPIIGTVAPDFTLTRSDLSSLSLADLAGQQVVLNIFPSIDTPVCAASAKEFNSTASSLKNCKVLCVSMDLPFAHNRFCQAQGLQDIIPLSDFRSREFGQSYGVTIIDGALAGLLARAVIVLDASHKVAYAELVSEISDPPNYSAVLAALQA